MKSFAAGHKASMAVALALATFSSCATFQQGRQAPAPRTVGDVIQEDIKEKPAVVTVSESGEISVRGMKLKHNHFDIPIEINSAVEYWIDYFTGKGRPHFERYLARSEYFIPYITPLLKQNGLPEDLVYLAMIESGFNNFARSRARAVGPWQFISATGKRYGLMVNWWVDERRDIRKSTLAAVEYLHDLYTMFGSWELAAASYNSGEMKIARAVQRFGTRDFWVIARHRFLRPETRDYVPKIIAAAILAKNRDQFGFQNAQPLPGKDEAVAGDGEIVKLIKTDKPEKDVEVDPNSPDSTKEESVGDAADQATQDSKDSRGVDQADADDDDDDDSVANKGPTITPATLLVQSEAPAAVPSPGQQNAPSNAGQSSGNDQPLAKQVATPHVSKDGKVSGEELAEFDVQSPADLLKISRAAGLSYQTVKNLNPELLRWCTPPTVGSYRIKLPSSVKEKFLATYNHSAFPRKVQFMEYKVRPGETLARIAQHFGIKVDPISDLNGVSARMPLRHGIKVLLPMPNDRSRSLASLDVRDPPEAHHRGHRRRGRYYRITYKRRESARLLSNQPGNG